MAWWKWGWWTSRGPWPGRGPFSHLPPWERPGWLLYGARPWYPWSLVASVEAEKNWLNYRKIMIENTLKILNDELAYIERRLKELESAGQKQ
ncbi:MAG: hypothetical protein OWQ48_06650 [Desulfurococcus sp.]|nr:hypothetical protein [Desulfurococcus sp.]